MKRIIRVDVAAVNHNIDALPGDRKRPIIIANAENDDIRLDVNGLELLDKEGYVCATMVYRPDSPLPDNGRVWIETEYEVRPI